MNIPRTLWRLAGNIQLTVVLCGLLTVNLACAYPAIKGDLTLYMPMNDIGVYNWLRTYGLSNWTSAWWFMALLLLLTALGLNTFVCTTDRLLGIVRGRRPGWFLKLAPHIMHYAVLVILSGYLASYLLALSLPGRALKPGDALVLPNGAGSVVFEKFEPIYYEGERLETFDGFILNPRAKMILRAEGRPARVDWLFFSHPVSLSGYKIFMEDFLPRRKAGGMDVKSLKLIVRYDPSASIYLAGLALFVLGLGLYVFDRVIKR
jgi:hypothetical protein